jgi:hypothetical protein
LRNTVSTFIGAGVVILAVLIQPHLPYHLAQSTARRANDNSQNIYLPSLFNIANIPTRNAACIPISPNSYDTVPIDSSHYKNNQITDNNADFRLSLLGAVPVNEALEMVDYPGYAHPTSPRFHSMFLPQRTPTFLSAYRRYDWIWDERADPPYGVRGGVNNEWRVSALDVATNEGEPLYIPSRSVVIGNGGHIALVLYASENELTITYSRSDSVTNGWVLHMMGLCVDPNLVTLYRAQLREGKRATGNLPGIRPDQSVGTAGGDRLTIAIRDRGAFLDPRSRKDWWQGAPPMIAPPVPTATPPRMLEATPIPPTPTPLPPTLTPTPIPPTPTPLPPAPTPTPISYCPDSNQQYLLTPKDGGHYKNNALSDNNADFRLSLLGYSRVNEALHLVDYAGDTDPNAPKLHGLFEPNRVPTFWAAYRRHDWHWSNDAPPYGSRGGVNNDWSVTVIEMAMGQGESIFIPERNVPIWGGGVVALVLFADVKELTLAYSRSDSVTNGYVVHINNICVEPNLLRAYREQLSVDGRRATNLLPAVRNNQRIGTADGSSIFVAVRDGGAFLDPRSRKDWW